MADRVPFGSIHTMSRWPILIAASILTCLVAVLFFPILGFEFVNFDVGQQVVENPHIRGLTGENLKHIFTSRCIGSYYPARTLTFAVDYHFWGLNPRGFKLTNGLIHLANVFLVFWLILRIFGQTTASDGPVRSWWDVSVAAFSAGVFAVHPVVVEPVAWVAGREELLMTLGALGCFHFHLGALRSSERGNRAWASAAHVASACCCAAACLSNAVAAVIPLLVTTWDLLTLAPPKLGRILRGTAALWVIGLATLIIKVLSGNPESDFFEVDVGPVGRVMLILNVYWMNLQTLVWPTNLAIDYGRLTPKSFLEPTVILGGIALVLTCLALWRLRRRKVALFGLFWFGLALGPSAQVLVHHIHRADRFLYLPLVGLAIAMAVAIRGLDQVRNTRATVVGASALGTLILILLSARSAEQVQVWQNCITLWENCAKVRPNNSFAHNNLATNLKLRGQPERAEIYAIRALELDFADNHRSLYDRAVQLSTSPDESLRNYSLAIRLAQRANELTGWKNQEYLRTLAVAHCTWANEQAGNRRFVKALENYRKAIKTDPAYDAALFNLAILLTSCDDRKLRNPDAAVRLAQRGCDLTEELDPHKLSILSMAQLEAGRLDDAVATAEEAARLAAAGGDDKLAADIRRWVKDQLEKAK